MRRVIVLAAAIAVSGVWIVPSWAGTIDATIGDGLLTVTGTVEADDVTVGCAAGDVTVNQADPSGGPFPCADLHSIVVHAGDGSDRVDLGEVTRSGFAALVDVEVFGEDGGDTLIGSWIGDLLDGAGGSDDLRGGDGSDRLVNGAGAGEAAGGEGKDLLSLQGDSAWDVNDDRVQRQTPYEETTIHSIERIEIVMGPGDNFVAGPTFSDSLFLHGRGGNDLFDTGTGRDLLDGGGGNDRLESGPGNDRLLGGPGDDFLSAEEGNDVLNGGPGGDGCNGGSGSNSFTSCDWTAGVVDPVGHPA
jgi:Ca2+-binding RTX toxin-like protein